MIIETILHQEDQSKTFCSLWNYRIISKSYKFFFDLLRHVLIYFYGIGRRSILNKPWKHNWYWV